MQANGTFQVKITPVEGTALEKEAAVGRMTIDKTWNGTLTGSSKGTMLTSMTESSGAMAYVALEKVEGTLAGKSGSFYFSHGATMYKGEAASGVSLIKVVKGSGTGELSGLAGDLRIDIDAKGNHSYVLEYEIA